MRVGIVGLGLIGGSLGMALRGLQHPLSVVGLTRTADAAAEALRRGAVEAASTDVAILNGSDVVVIATPIDQIPGALDLIAPLAASGTVITDVASVKRPVRQWARRLPEPGLFLGGHPVAGKSVSGIGASDPAIFRGEPWIFTPLESQSLRPFEGWIELVGAIGARPAFRTPEEHDRQMAYLSHLAFAVSTAFAETVAEHADASLGGPGYRSTARLATGDASMYESIARENREPMVEAIDQFRARLQSIRDRIERGDQVTELFAVGRHLAV
jgi:prephenate dehydrogenase